ncbi:amidohydrolase family protein [Frankia sp. AgB1.9]|uniref:amidohydrolase family protein n=1 Tax=unclassified Frankia TaxID=2632575 RepID=UPI001931C9CD|nr:MULTISPECIES: amidohydrolase family protein [unclassified Frankia]MBL7491776.1 amidohydrolase family protein [Frankia sp. AgW1.1]MBL7550670.1 amidohydrolase family protein [Frankia sp. AgB1.9]MBL7617706.1 amidohydrolase family protein [Frankia sp. AgB1.8]
MEELGHPVWDADNHYYEAVDAFTRHLDPRDGPRCVQWATINGRQYHVLGGQVSRAVSNATFDPISRPGCLAAYFRGNPDKANPLDLIRDSEPVRAEYRDPAARLRVLDEQGLEGCFLFPTLGMIYEEPLRHDPVAVTTTFRAFNRWLAEDWTFDYRGRVLTAPYLTLADVDWAVEELEWAIDHGARMVVMRAAAPTTALGQRSPFDPMFAPFWARLNEAGLALVVHAGDSGVSSDGYGPDSHSFSFSGAGYGPTIASFAIEEAVHNYLLTMVLSNHLARYPNLRVASVENGAEFLPDLFRKLRSQARKLPGWFREDPVEIFRRHVWINPFWEDDLASVVGWVGADRVLFGSDWPHIEGLPAPLDYVPETKALTPTDRRLVLRENAVALATPRPA